MRHVASLSKLPMVTSDNYKLPSKLQVRHVASLFKLPMITSDINYHPNYKCDIWQASLNYTHGHLRYKLPSKLLKKIKEREFFTLSELRRMLECVSYFLYAQILILIVYNYDVAVCSAHKKINNCNKRVSGCDN